MATNNKRLTVTEFDFDEVKANLKTFLKAQNEFTDYDFEGSGMSVLLDLLAYNTHYLGFNMIVEPHILERPRVAYGSGDIYLGVNDRRNLKGALYLRQLIANMKRR